MTPATAPVPGADVPARIITAPGGAGANTAAWLAARGVDVTLVARVGDDVAGRAVVDGLAAAGVQAAVAVDPDAPTATVVVLVGPGGERTMLSDRGAAARLAAADLPPLDGVDHLHLSGYVLGAGSCAAGLAALAAARAAGASTSLDPQATGTFPADLLSRLGGVDLLLPNAAELAALTGSPEPPRPWRCWTSRAPWSSRRGRRGRAGWTATVCALCGASAVADVVADATGAGDAFDAGLLAAWLAGAGPEAALLAGCAAGAEAVSRRGGRRAPGVTSRSSRTSPVDHRTVDHRAVEARVTRVDHRVRAGLQRRPVGLVAVDLLALAGQPVVRDEHGHPGQRDRDDQERDGQPGSLVEDRGQHHARHPHAHHQRRTGACAPASSSSYDRAASVIRTGSGELEAGRR